MKREYVFAAVVLCLGLASWALMSLRGGGGRDGPACPMCGPGLGMAPPAASRPSSAPTSAASTPHFSPADEANAFNRALRNIVEEVRLKNTVFSLTGLDRLRRTATSLGQDLERSLNRQFHDSRAYVAAGDRAMAREDFQTALGCFEAARLLDANNPDAAMGRAIALTALGRNEDAEPAYRELLARLPGDRTTKYNLAVTLMKLGRNGEAQGLFEALAESDGNFLPAWYNLGAIYTAGGKLARAREAWRKAAALSPRLAYPCMKLGEVLMDLEEPNEALSAFAEAAKRDPNDPSAQMNVAAASVRLGSFGRAVLATERAAKLAPNDPGVWASLGNLRVTIYTATKEKRFLREALDAWGRSLALDANQPDVKNNAELFRKELDGATSRDTVGN